MSAWRLARRGTEGGGRPASCLVGDVGRPRDAGGPGVITKGKTVHLSATARTSAAVLCAGAIFHSPARSQSAAGMRVYADRAHGDLVVESAPMDVAARTGSANVLPTMAVAPVGGWVHGYTVALVDINGRTLPRDLLQHMIITVPNRRGLFDPVMLRLVAAGTETQTVHLPGIVGYRVHQGDTLLIAGTLQNPGGEAYRGVRLQVRMPMRSEHTLIHPITIYPFSMDVMPAGTQRTWDLPPGPSRRSWEGHPAVAGRILGIGGHLRRYGVSLRLDDVTAGTLLWEGRAVRDAAGDVVELPTQTYVAGIPVEPDHVYRLTATYDNPTGRTIPGGGMGMAGGAIIPADGARWPAADPRDPQFRLDLQANTPAAPAASPRGAP